MRTRTLVVSLVAVAIAVVVIVALSFGNVDRFRPRIQAELQQKLNRPVTLGHLGLKLLPLEIKIDGLTIGESPAFATGRPFATANMVFVSAGLISLLTGNPEVKNLTLEKPQIELVKNAAGTWNFSSLGKQGGGGGQSEFSLGLLKIEDGQVGFTDEAAKQARAVYDHIDLKISDFAPNKEFGVDLAVHFPGEGKETLAFNGKAGPLGGNAEAPPLNGHASLEQISLSGINRFAAGSVPADTDAVISGDADIKGEANTIACKGNVKLENAVINGAKIDYSISATYDLRDDLKQKKIQVTSGTVQLGPTAFTASGEVDGATTPSNLNVHLKTDNSSITELAKLAGAFGVGFSPAYKVTGTVSADLTAKGPATAPQMSGSITAKTLQASGGEIKQPVSVPEIDLTLTPDSVVSNTFTARSGSTALAIAFSLSQYATKNMNVDASVKTDGANIAELLNIAKAYGVDAAQGMSGDGKLSLDVHVKGPAANASALTYAGTASISNATLTTPQLTKPLTVTAANAKFSQNSVGLDGLAATLGGTTVKGSLAAKNFAAPEVQFNLSADKIDTDELERIVAPTPKQRPVAKGGKPGPSMLQLTTGGGNLAAGTIKADDIVLKNVSAKCKLDKGVIQLSPLSAEMFNGKANGSLTADMRPAVPQCTVAMKMAGVDSNALLSAVSSMKNTVYGNLAADSNLRFALASSNDLAQTLNGTVSFNLTNGLIKNIDLINEVEKVGKFLKSATPAASTGGGTELKKFSGTLNIVNGVATTDNLTGVLNAGSLSAKGTLNLVNQAVNMHMTAVLGSATSQKVGGAGIGGYLNTALANNKGELILPVIVSGNMAHPSVMPDAQAMAKMKLSSLLPTSGDPSKATAGNGVAGILGGLLGGQQQGPSDAKQKQAQPANPLGGILDQFKKKKTPPQ